MNIVAIMNTLLYAILRTAMASCMISAVTDFDYKRFVGKWFLMYTSLYSAMENGYHNVQPGSCITVTFQFDSSSEGHYEYYFQTTRFSSTD